MKAQIIEKNGQPEFAVIPYEDYRHFLELLEDEADDRPHRLVSDSGLY